MRRRHPMLAAAAALLLAAVGPSATASAAAGSGTPAVQRLVVLGRAHEAFASPDARAVGRARVSARRPITGARTVLPVIGERTAADGGRWLRVLLPGRPNGATGWISSRATSPATTSWRLRVSVGARRVTVLRRGRAVRTFRAVVGARSTPTPRGRFFVEETVRLGAGRVGAPFALALSARSDVLDQFAGGPGQIALHGLGNIGGVLGTAASHGCVRLDDRAVTWLAGRIGPGVPVTIGR